VAAEPGFHGAAPLSGVGVGISSRHGFYPLPEQPAEQLKNPAALAPVQAQAVAWIVEAGAGGLARERAPGFVIEVMESVFDPGR